MVNQHSAAECAGLLAFFFREGDAVPECYRKRNRWFSRHDLELNSVADRLLKKMLDEDRVSAMQTLLSQTTEGDSMVWIANDIRDLLWQNGLAGDRAVAEQERVLTDAELERVRQAFCERLAEETGNGTILHGRDLSGFVRAWRDIAGTESLTDWITQNITDDEAFLRLLMGLRTHTISSATGHSLILKPAEIAHLFGGEEALQDRLNRIPDEGRFTVLSAEINDAIARSKFY